MVKRRSVDENQIVPMTNCVVIMRRWLDGIIKLADKGRSRDQAACILAKYNQLIERCLPKEAFLICLTDPEINRSDAERTRLTMLYEATWKALDSSGTFSLRCEVAEIHLTNGNEEVGRRIVLGSLFDMLGRAVDAWGRNPEPCYQLWKDLDSFMHQYFNTTQADGGHFQRAFSSAKRRYLALEGCKKQVIVPFMHRIVRSKAQSLKGLIWAIEILLNHRRSSFLS